MALYEDLYTDIRADVHQAPDFAILKNIQAVATEFFTRTGVWQVQADDLILHTGRSEYQAWGDNSARVLKVLRVWQGSRVLHHVTLPLLASRGVDDLGQPELFALSGQSIKVYPVPGADEEGARLSLFVILTPDRDAKSLPDDQFDLWRDALVYGTKARMMESPTQTWSNGNASMHFRSLYNRELRRAKQEGMSSHGAPLRVSPNSFC